jgi:hypothetical protein
MSETPEQQPKRKMYLVKCKPTITLQEMAQLMNLLPIIVDEGNKERLGFMPNIQLLELPDVITNKIG